MKKQTNRRDFLKCFGVALPLVALHMSPAGRLLQNMTHVGDIEKPNILILLFDTFSASHLSTNHYPRATTPHLDRFAQRANIYHKHYAGGNFTSPGTASLLTGTYPWTNRALHIYSTVAEGISRNNIFNAFDDSYYKIAYTHNRLAATMLYQFQGAINHLKPMRDLFIRDSRYTENLFAKDFTAAYLAEINIRGTRLQKPTSMLLSSVDKLLTRARTRDLALAYKDSFPLGVPDVDDQHFILEDAIDWLISTITDLPRPFLAYIHLMPPHDPYLPRKEFIDYFAGDQMVPVEKPEHYSSPKSFDQQELNWFRKAYDEYILYTDSEFGRLADYLDRVGLLDETFTVFTSDHGELFERGILRHTTPALYEPIIRIPLLIRRPGQRTRHDFRTVTSCVDLLPTLLQATGQRIPGWCEGMVLPGFEREQLARDRAVFAVDAQSNVETAPLENATFAMIKGNYKLINNRGKHPDVDTYELYDLENDPEELNNLNQTRKGVSSALQDELETQLHSVAAI